MCRQPATTKVRPHEYKLLDINLIIDIESFYNTLETMDRLMHIKPYFVVVLFIFNNIIFHFAFFLSI